jgi:4-amino-4-deoxy-L-arabinose transferase-like glycosyltransferase
MEAPVEPLPTVAVDGPSPRRAGWLTPVRCRVLFVAVLLLNMLNGWWFLTHHCPIDLLGDEAQYWTWSRHLAAGYYSKGPLVAWIIRGSCSLLGNTMPAVRAPALLLAVGTSCCTYWLTRKLFGSDRLALGAFLLGGIVPMFAAGGTLMTIDPPLFFCWALSTCFVAKAIFDRSRWAWPAAGVAAGFGVLAKYAMLLWPPLVLIYLALDPSARRWLRTPGPWVMTAVALAFLAPPMVWNAQHDWVTFHHVATQVGGERSEAHPSTGPIVARLFAGVGHAIANVLGMAGIQAAAINPVLCVFVVAAVVYALGRRSVDDPHRAALRFLLAIGGGFWLTCLLDALLAKVEPNWPAPAYFTLLILTAYFIATVYRDNWKPWRGWFYGAVAFGLVASTLLHDTTRLYPFIAWVDRTFPRSPGKDGQPRAWLTPKIDIGHKMRGVADPFATTVDAELRQLRPGAFVLCEDYMDASQLSFYLPGQPATYFAGSYWTDPAVRRRWTQFDVWPDRQLDQAKLIGHDAVYIGWPNYAPLRQSFDRVIRLPDIVVRIDGLEVRRWTVTRCEGFHGMERPLGPGPR